MRKKCLIIIIKNYYFLKSNGLEKTFDGEQNIAKYRF